MMGLQDVFSARTRRWHLKFILAALAVGGPAHADIKPTVPEVRCGGLFNLCGYVHADNRSEVIPQRFERAMRFSDGLAAVRINGLFGYINIDGEVVIKPAFDAAGPFNNGLAEVLIGDHTGVINQAGKLVLPAQYGRSIPLTEDVVIAHEGPYRKRFGFDSETLENGPTDFFLHHKPSGLFKIGKGWLTGQQYWFQYFSDGAPLIWASLQRHGGLYGMLRTDGTWQTLPAFERVQPLFEGRAIVTEKGTNGHVLWGAVDEKGNLEIPPKFEHLTYWTGDYAVARMRGKQAFIDKHGRPLGGRFFDAVMRGNPIGWVGSQEGWFPINADGSLGKALASKPTPYGPNLGNAGNKPFVSQENTSCPSGATIYQQDGLWGIKGPDGTIMIPARYPAIDCFRQGVAWVPDLKKKAWCPIGPDGEPRSKPDCERDYYPYQLSHHYPEKNDDDRFVSSLLWMQAFLQYGLDPTKTPPRMIGDGVQGKGAKEIRCRIHC